MPNKKKSPKNVNTTAESNKAESVAWIGLDVHAKFSVMSWMDEKGERREHWRFPTTENQVVKHLMRIQATTKRLAMEECGMARWLAQVVRPHVSEVIVCDPRENFRISRHHHKCDQEDAYNLAHLNRLGSLKRVWQPENDRRAVFKCAVQSYLDTVQRQTAIKLQLKAHYRQWGVVPVGTAVYSRRGRAHYLNQIQELGVRAQLQLVYQMLDCALEVQSKASRLMVQLGRDFPEIVRLRKVPGVGRVGAHLFVAYIQEPSRFATAQQFFRYCRMGIRDRSSDNKPLGFQQLDRCGHGVLKAIGYRAWMVAQKQPQGVVCQFYTASLMRTGDSTHARLNTQRKVLLTMKVLWESGQEFDAQRFLGNEAQPTTKATCG